MTTWTADELKRIGGSDEIQIAGRGGDGVVVVDVGNGVAMADDDAVG